MSTSRAFVQVHGKVQGVYYRVSAQKQALYLGVTGWVRNCPDSSVEMVIEGNKEHVEAMLAWCKVGPAGANIDRISVDWEPSTGEFTNFHIAPDKEQSC